ncbi:GNAT family N-acetyltransferase [Pseudaquidulcibacter saccharophilus]|uniref:GNAT family N-acetyltransferase n=1 Tax=Pseudaquidulcibacter saccharophilus TaxID=2831900 RepID=UPI001EFF00D7|nr:GNAT family N-acetyltransferase [Pseudaquidulcibacter saccharophilus]
MTDFTSKIHNSIHEIDRSVWNNLNGDSIFTSFEYLSALEDTKCVGVETGWQIAHLSISENGEIIGLVPLYLKYHSQGEYVFDQGWAKAYEDAGGRYYPKLLSASPFTPVVGGRLLAHNLNVKAALLTALRQICQTNNISSAHINFANSQDIELIKNNGFMVRQDLQYWWLNDGFNSFDDFLATTTASRRKTMKRERREVADKVQFQTIQGNDITESHLDTLYTFIADTYERKWGRGIPYLTRAFFSRIKETMADTMVLIFGKINDEYVSGAINFYSGDTLYGRQWGCNIDLPFLHFETCYYQAIDFAIRNNIRKVEAGTQGEHKISRGYRPHKTYSGHYIVNESFRHAVGDFLAHETREIDAIIPELNDKLPFKKG